MAIKTGFIYFLIMFAVGFALGVVRVLLVVPHVGELYAVLLEVPLMVFISWQVSRWVLRRYFKGNDLQNYLIIGVSALLFLIIVEYLLAVTVFHRSTSEFILGLQSLPGAIGLTGQIIFGAIPVMQKYFNK
jgi:hypothetical protein